MLRPEGRGVAFRHDLARMAVEEEVAPVRREELHRRALAALADSPDLARLAHHAEAAGDTESVLRYAPRPLRAPRRSAPIARRLHSTHGRSASVTSSPRRSAHGCSSGTRASCTSPTTSQEAISVGEAALELRRRLGQKLEEGDALRWLAEILWCPGRTADAERTAREAVALLETLPEGHELAAAYVLLGMHCGSAGRNDEAIAWASNGLALAHRLGDTAGGHPGAEGDWRAEARPRRA